MMRLCSSIASALLAPFQLGYAIVIVNTMLDNVSETLDFDKNVGGALASAIFYFGCGIGGIMCNRFERLTGKFSQTGVAFFFMLGSLLAGFSNTTSFCWGGPIDGCVPYMLFFGRILCGIGGGLGSVISPKYLAVIAPPRIRGSLGVVLEVSLVLGVLCGFLIGLPYEFDSFDIGYSWWRIMFLAGAIPAMLEMLLNWVSLLREEKLDVNEEKTVELSNTATLNSKKDMETIPTSVSETPQVDIELGKEKEGNEKRGIRRWLKLFEKKYRTCVLLGLGMPILGQLSGINVIGSYSTTIFEDAGFDQAIVGSILIGVANLIFTGISAMVYERFNRKTIAFFSFGGMAITMAGVAFSSLGKKAMSGPLSIVFVLSYIGFFSAGCGTLALCYAPELVPPEIEHLVLGTGQSLSYLTTLILVLIFPSVLDSFGALPSFLVFFGINFGIVMFLACYMIETKGKPLQAIHQEVLRE